MRGTVQGDRVELRSNMPANGSQINFVFTGTVSGNSYSGDVNTRVNMARQHSRQSKPRRISAHERTRKTLCTSQHSPLSACVDCRCAGGGRASAVAMPPNPLPYDLLLVNGHVLDDKNHIDANSDVGIKDGKIAAVAAHLDPKNALENSRRERAVCHARASSICTCTSTPARARKNSYAGDLSAVSGRLSRCATALPRWSTQAVPAGVISMTFNDKIIKRSRDARACGTEHRRLRHARSRSTKTTWKTWTAS